MSVKEFIPVKARRAVYAIFALIGLCLGATQVGYSAADAGQPVWLTVALSVFAFVSAGVGYTARANAPLERPVQPAHESAPTYYTSDPAERGKPGAIYRPDTDRR